MSRAYSIIISILVLCSFAQAETSEWTMETSMESNVVSRTIRPQLLFGDSLRYLHEGVDRSVHIDSIVSLSRTTGRDKTVRGVMFGAVGFGAAGYFLGMVLDKDNPISDPNDKRWLFALLGGVLGGGLGGALAPPPEHTRYQLAAYSHEQKLFTIRSILERDSAVVPVPSEPARQATDIVYLKNGSIIRGSVLEVIPDSSLKIRTADGSLFVFKMTEVDRIGKEETPSVPASPKLAAKSPTTVIGTRGRPDQEFEQKPVNIRIRAGLGIPTGDFASTTGDESGAAALGFALGVDIMHSLNATSAIGGSATVSFNSVDLGVGLPAGVDLGSWTTVWLTVAAEVHGPSEMSVQPYFQPRVGLLIASGPTITAGGSTLDYSTGTAIAYGGAVGFKFAGRVTFEGSFLAGRPEFTVNARTPTGSGTLKGSLPVTIASLSLGYSF